MGAKVPYAKQAEALGSSPSGSIAVTLTSSGSYMYEILQVPYVDNARDMERMAE